MEEERAGSKPYPTDLRDTQWKEIAPLYSGMRNRKWSKRKLTNTVLYIVKTGCQWRQLPHDFPPYQTVYSFFSREAKSGLLEKILTYLVGKSRKDTGKSAEPHYMLIDAQSVKFFIWQTPVTWRSAIKKKTIIADKTSNNGSDRVFRTRFTLKSMEFKKTGTYYLTIVEKESGTVVGWVEFTIDVAFVNDFDS